MLIIIFSWYRIYGFNKSDIYYPVNFTNNLNEASPLKIVLQSNNELAGGFEGYVFFGSVGFSDQEDYKPKIAVADGDIIKIPIGVLFAEYNYVDVENGLAQNKLKVASDGYKLKLNVNPQQVIQKNTIFAAHILAD